MTQQIAITEVRENGEIIRRSDANFAKVSKALMDLDGWREKFPWLSTIDEYGDTYFNYLQLPYFIQEINALAQAVNDEDVKEEVRQINEFIGDTSRHKYIKFIGD